MGNITIRFYAELNDFLPERLRQVAFSHEMPGTGAVKDVIESLGVPHTEVDLILVNGVPVGFSHPVRDGDVVSVYPVFESFDIAGVSKVRPEPLREIRFVADCHLGRLAAYLRMVGFDTLYQNDCPDKTLAEISEREHRILLTRDRGLLKRSMVTHGYYVRSQAPRAQLEEVSARFHLAGKMRPFSRCMACNALLHQATKEEVYERLPERIREEFSEFSACPSCGRVYWRGSHYDRMRRLVQVVCSERPEV